MDRDAWIEAHRGRITASRFATIMHGGPRAWTTLLTQLREERAGGPVSFDSGVSSASLRWGHTYEADARRTFALVSGLRVRECGRLILHPEMDDVGASPDALIEDEYENVWSGAEIKVPYDEKIHVEYRIHGLPDKYRPQVQGTMWLLGLESYYFVSYDPRARDARGDIAIHHIDYDRAYCQRLETKIRRFREHLHDGTNPEPAEVPQDVEFF